MVRSRIAAVVAAGTLALGGGIALAETDPEDPSLDTTDDTEVVTETDGAETEDTETETEDVTDTDELVETEEVAETDELVETEEVDDLDGEGPPEGTHGAVVSAAAKDHSHDEACGNHGRWVSHWARHGEAPECADEASTEDDLGTVSDEQTEDTEEGSDDTEETNEDTTEVSAASTTDGDAPGKGKGRGKKR